MDHTALMLVDIQNDYFPDGKMMLENMDLAAENAALLLRLFRELGLPVFHIQHVSSQPNALFFQADTTGVEIHTSVTPAPGESVIIKHFPNSFRETPLLNQLHAATVKKLVICGAMSHMCIDATVRAAADAGFNCLVAYDACATRELSFFSHTVVASEVHAAFMAALSGLYARVLSSSTIMDKIK